MKSLAKWQDTQYASKADLIEAVAQRRHAANLESGGVFNEDGTRFSDIAIERQCAETHGATYVSAHYAFTVGLQRGAWYVENYGWAAA